MSRRLHAGLFFLLAAALLIADTSAQSLLPEVEWSRTTGCPFSDGAWSAALTRDGCYILAGYTTSRGEGSDLWLVKVNLDGEDQWNRIFGGSGEDLGYFVLETDDGDYVVTGTTSSFGIGEERLWLLKTDSDGNRQWERTFGGFVSSAGDGGWSLDQTDDGGFIVTGYTKSFGTGNKDLWLVKTDSLGNGEWDRAFGGSKDDVGMSVLQTRDSGYIVAGRTASYGSGKDDIWLLKTDSSGKENWNRTFGGRSDDVAFQVVELEDGYALVGRTESSRLSGKRAFLIKTDPSGKVVWDRAYSEDSAGICMQRTSDGGFIIAGRIESKSGRDALLIKADSAGQMVWTLPLESSGEETATAISETSDGGYLMAGISSICTSCAEDLWLIKLRPPVQAKNDSFSGGSVADNSTANESLSLVPIDQVPA
jgi:hypothetical protein